MSAPNLAQFRSELNKRNVARPSHYYVQIVPPPSFSELYGDQFAVIDPTLVSMWCSQAMTPQTTIATRDEFLVDGTKRKYAYDQDFQNLTLHFYLDQDFDIQKFFDQWKYAIVPQRRKFNYPDNYTANSLNIFILNQEGVATYKYEYFRVFPKSINSVELSYNSGTTFSTFSVDFVFEDYYYTSIKDNKTSKPDLQVETPVLPANRELVQTTEYDPNGYVINTQLN
jgi:hypothetical protein